MKFNSLRQRFAYFRELTILWRRQEISFKVACHSLYRPTEYLPTKDGVGDVWIWDDVARAEEMAWRDLNPRPSIEINI